MENGRKYLGTPDGVSMMHAVLLPNSNRVLYWGYGPRPDRSRVWDQSSGMYLQLRNQPSDISPDENIWSGSHAFKSDGSILIHAGWAIPQDPNNPNPTTPIPNVCLSSLIRIHYNGLEQE